MVGGLSWPPAVCARCNVTSCSCRRQYRYSGRCARFAVTIWAKRRLSRLSRLFWLIGAVLLAATLLKRVLFDLSHVTEIERTASFIGIGSMVLLIGFIGFIGFFSPLPPKAMVLETEQ
ncbi:Predicted membrane protein [Burkholderia sp. WP9]|nr:Predicted membrane protein [Burkholderia sp. WP9]